MTALGFSLLVHIIGVGMIFTTIFAGWILESRSRKIKDWSNRLTILRLLRSIGLLSPAGVLVMLVSGILNMHFAGLGVFSASWLTLKLVFFALLVISGVLFGIRGTQRTRLVSKLADGKAPEHAERMLGSLERQQRLFFIVQTVLMLVILSLSIFKPST